MTTAHDLCRAAVLDGELGPEDAAHLRACPTCARLSDDLERLERVAPSLGHPPPPGLADRVVARIRAERAAPTEAGEAPAATEARSTPRPRRRRRLALGGAAAAAVLVVVATVAGVAGGGGGSLPDDVLLVAATRTAALESARLRLDGIVDVDVEGLAEGSYRIRTTGAGVIRFPDRARFSFSLDFLEGDGTPSTSERLIVGDRSWAREPGQAWRRFDPGSSPAAGLLYRPDAVLQTLRSAGSRPDPLPPRTVDGVRVDGYRFSVPAGFLPAPFPAREGGPGPAWTVEAWVGEEDGVLRRLTVAGSGTSDDPARLRWRTELALSLSDFAVDEAVEPPPAGEPEAGAAGS